MNRSSFVASAVGTVFLFLTAASQAVIVPFEVTLNGSNENPSNLSPGTGFASLQFDTDAHTLGINLSFSGLLGATTAAHIHCCVAAPGNVGVAIVPPSLPGFPTGVSSGTYAAVLNLAIVSTYSSGFVTASGGSAAGAEAALLAAMLAGNSYLNVHSTMFPGGEIRGFTTVAVPEPAALGLLAAGLLLGVGRRRRRVPSSAGPGRRV